MSDIFDELTAESPPTKRDIFDELTPDDISKAQSVRRQLGGPPRTAPSRSFVGDIASGAARGMLINLPEMVGRSIKPFAPELGENIVIGTEELKDRYDILKPSKEEQESYIRRSVAGGVEAIPQSIAIPMTGAAIGTAILPGVGTVIGGLGGLALNLAGFYGSTYDRFMEDARKEGIPDDQSSPYAHLAASIESGGEAVADIVGAVSFGFGKPLAKGVTTGAVKTLRQLLNPSWKQLGKAAGKTLTAEVGTEIGQNIGERWAEQQVGIPGESLLTAGVEAVGPAFVMTAAMGGGAHTISKINRTITQEVLANPIPDNFTEDTRKRAIMARAGTIDIISEMLAKDEEYKPVAPLWQQYAKTSLVNNQPIDIDMLLDLKTVAYATAPESVKAGMGLAEGTTPVEQPVPEIIGGKGPKAPKTPPTKPAKEETTPTIAPESTKEERGATTTLAGAEIAATEETEGQEITIAPTKDMWDMTQFDLDNEWGKVIDLEESTKAKNAPRIDEITKTLESMKGSRGKEANDQKKVLRDELQTLRDESGVIRDYYEGRLLERNMELSDDFLERAKQAGVDVNEDNITDLTDQFQTELFERAGREYHWGKTVSQIADEIIKEHLEGQAPGAEKAPETAEAEKVPEGQAGEEAKQPWEMTGEEWATWNLEQYRKLHDGKNPRHKSGWTLQTDEEALTFYRQSHKGLITKALSEGKPVPPHVLYEYPELRAEENKRQANELLDDIESAKEDIKKKMAELKGEAPAEPGKEEEKKEVVAGEEEGQAETKETEIEKKVPPVEGGTGKKEGLSRIETELRELTPDQIDDLVGLTAEEKAPAPAGEKEQSPLSQLVTGGRGARLTRRITKEEAIKTAVSKAGEGVSEAFSGLYELFGGASLKSFPAGFNEDTYAKAKPHFQKSWEAFKEAGYSLKQFVDEILATFGKDVRMYLSQFLKEMSGAAEAPEKAKEEAKPEKQEAITMQNVGMYRNLFNADDEKLVPYLVKWAEDNNATPTWGVEGLLKGFGLINDDGSVNSDKMAQYSRIAIRVANGIPIEQFREIFAKPIKQSELLKSPYVSSPGFVKWVESTFSGEQAYSNGVMILRGNPPYGSEKGPDFDQIASDPQPTTAIPVAVFQEPNNGLNVVYLSDGSAIQAGYYQYIKQAFPDVEFVPQYGTRPILLSSPSHKGWIGALMQVRGVEAPNTVKAMALSKLRQQEEGEKVPEPEKVPEETPPEIVGGGRKEKPKRKPKEPEAEKVPEDAEREAAVKNKFTDIGYVWDPFSVKKEFKVTGALDKDFKQIMDHSTRANVFLIDKTVLTPGAVRYAEWLRGVLPTLTDIAKDNLPWRRRGRRAPSITDQIRAYFTQDATRLDELREIAVKYVSAVRWVASTIKDGGNLTGISSLFLDILYNEEGKQKVLNNGYASSKDHNEEAYNIIRDGFAPRYCSDFIKDRFVSGIARFVATEDAPLEEGPPRRFKNTEVIREGLPERRKGDITSSEEFNKPFDLAGVGFGTWVEQKERQRVVNAAYDALLDLSEIILKAPSKAISFGHRLALQFGNIGSLRSHAAAFFVPDENTINLTKTNGDGTLGHEWAHSFDHNVRDVSEEVNNAVQSLISSFSKRVDLEKAMEAVRNAAINQERYADSYMFMDYKKGYDLFKAVVAKLFDEWAHPETNYYERARKADGFAGKYQTKEEEMFARVFEAYIYDRLGGTNNYLVNEFASPENAEQWKTTYGFTQQSLIYPSGIEREEFNQALDYFIENIIWGDDGKPTGMAEGYVDHLSAQLQAVAKAKKELLDNLDAFYQSLFAGTPSADGLYWYRYDVTERGNFQQPQGYVAYDDDYREPEVTGKGAIGYPEPQRADQLQSFHLTNIQHDANAIYIGGENAESTREIGGELLEDESPEHGEGAQTQGGAQNGPGARTGDGGGGIGDTGGGGRIVRPGERGSADELDTTPAGGPGAETPGGPNDVPVAGNYHITDLSVIGHKSLDQRFKDNIAAIRLLRILDTEVRPPTDEEKDILVRYTGWGGFSEAFSRYSGPYWQAKHALIEELLTADEYEAGRTSSLTAYYTSGEVAVFVHRALQRFGFTEGNILEPAIGTGNFFGTMPLEMKNNSNLFGIEPDSISKKVASYLYGNASISQGFYQDIRTPNKYYDVIISNVPFSREIHPADRKYNRDGSLDLHDYFFVKSLSIVRPGGIVAFLTARGTMDGVEEKAREKINTLGRFLGAIRLPEKIFNGITTSADILFFQKQEEGTTPVPVKPWIKTVKMDGTYVDKQGYETSYTDNINEYFHDNPQMVLGQSNAAPGQYGKIELHVDGTGRDLETDLSAAMLELPENIYRGEDREIAPVPLDEIIPSPSTVKEGAYYIGEDGKLYQSVNGLGVHLPEVEGKDTTFGDRMRRFIRMVIKRREVLRAQWEGKTDAEVTALQKQLGKEYDAFVKQYGFINKKGNWEAFSHDPDAPAVLALENWDPDKKTATKTDIFTKWVLPKVNIPTHVESAVDALNWSYIMKGAIDFQYMQKLTGMSKRDIIEQLGNVIYEEPELGGYVGAEDYLSGFVAHKLDVARDLATQDKRYERHVKALEAVMPEPLTPSQIAVNIGAPWIPPQHIETFIHELMGIDEYDDLKMVVEYSKGTGKWFVMPYTRHDRVSAAAAERSLKAYKQSRKATQTYGTDDADFFVIIEKVLNNQPVTITRRDSHGNQWVDKVATQLANEKVTLIKTKFTEFAWKDTDRAEQLLKIYNHDINGWVLRQKFDGSHMEFFGKSPEYPPGNKQHPKGLYQSQIDAVWRYIVNGNVYLAHEVGTGKSISLALIAMESKRLGIKKKPIIVTMKNVVEQLAAEFMRVYPSANVLVLNLGTDQIKNKVKLAKVVNNNWDAVIMSQPSFERIPLSPETLNVFIQEEIDEYENLLRDMQGRHGAGRSIKGKKGEPNRQEREIIRRIQALRQKLQRATSILAEEQQRHVYWEDLGCDLLLIDEAHSYKNVPFASGMRNIKGLNPVGADTSFVVYAKTRYMNARYKGKNGKPNGVVLASGTAISNSIGEIFNMQRMLQYEELKNTGLTHFDGWAASFCNIQGEPEPKLTGQGFKVVTKIANFVNVPELKRLAFQVMDVIRGDDVGIIRPKIKGGKPESLVIERNHFVEAYQQIIQNRAHLVEQDPHHAEYLGRNDNMLRIVTDGRKVSLDQRLIPEFAHTELQPEGKINRAADNIVRIYKETKAFNGTQLVFCNLGVPKKYLKSVAFTEKTDEEIAAMTDKDRKAYEDKFEDYQEYLNNTSETDFNTYDEIKRVLMSRGIPADQIVFIQEVDKNPVSLKKFMTQINNGEVRVVVGTAKRLGTGVNLQERVAAMHHLDVWWNFSSYEQSNGRGRRKGNINEEIAIYNYVTRGTVDSFMWDKVGSKGLIIAQFMSKDMTTRALSDVSDDAVNAKILAAVATDDPRRAEYAVLEKRVRDLAVIHGKYMDDRYANSRDIPRKQDYIESLNKKIAEYKKDIQVFEGTTAVSVDGQLYLLDKESSIDKLLTEIDKKMAQQKPLMTDPSKMEIMFKVPLGQLGTYTTEEYEEVVKDKDGKETKKKAKREIFKPGPGRMDLVIASTGSRSVEQRTIDIDYQFTGGTKPYHISAKSVKQGRADKQSKWIMEEKQLIEGIRHPDTAVKHLLDHFADSINDNHHRIDANKRDIATMEEELAKLFIYADEMEEKTRRYKQLALELMEATAAEQYRRIEEGQPISQYSTAAIWAENMGENWTKTKAGFYYPDEHKDSLVITDNPKSYSARPKGLTIIIGENDKLSSIPKGQGKDIATATPVAAWQSPDGTEWVFLAPDIAIKGDEWAFIAKTIGASRPLSYEIKTMGNTMFASVKDAKGNLRAMVKLQDPKAPIDVQAYVRDKEQEIKDRESKEAPSPESAPVLSRAADIPGVVTPPAPKYGVNTVTAMIQPILKKIPNAGKVKVLKSSTHMPVDVAEFLARHGVEIKKEDKVVAFYIPADAKTPYADTTFILADAIASQKDAQATVIHEIVGHRGILAVLSEGERKEVFRRVLEAYRNTEKGRKIIKDYRLDLSKPEDQTIFGGEVIAHIAQTGERQTLWNKVVAIIKAALRRIAPALKYGDAEVKALIERGWRYAEGGIQGRSVSGMARPDFLLAGKGAKGANLTALDRAMEMERSEDWLAKMPAHAREMVRGVPVITPGQKSDFIKRYGLPNAIDMGYGLFGRKTGSLFIDDETGNSVGFLPYSEGKSKEDIWKETGWIKGKDGKWRFEIDDSKAKVMGREGMTWGNREDMKKGNSVGMFLPDLLNHDQLYKEYPELRQIWVRLLSDYKGGSFNDRDIVIGYDSKSGDINKSTLFHEIQHAIQEQEGFAKGGSPGGPITNTERENLIDEEMKWLRLVDEKSGIPWRETYQKAMQVIDSPQGRHKIYTRLAGEAESREVANRMGMTAEERANKIPSWDGIKEEDLIVRMGATGQAAFAPHFMKGSIPTLADSPSKIKTFLTDNADALARTIAKQLPSNLPHLTFMERVLKNPLWYEHPVFKKIFDIMAHRRMERYFETFNDFNDAGEHKLITDALKRLKKKSKKGYDELGQIMIEADTEWVRDPEYTFEDRVNRMSVSKDVKDAAIMLRKAYDKMLEVRKKPMKDLLRKIEEEGYENDPFTLADKMGYNPHTKKMEPRENWKTWQIRPASEFDTFLTLKGKEKQERAGLPYHAGINYVMGVSKAGGIEVHSIDFNTTEFTDDQAKAWWDDHIQFFRKAHKDIKAELRQTLLSALNLMDEWKGYYSPRFREQGKWVVTGSRLGDDGEKEYIRMHKNHYGAQLAVKDLERQGWGDVTIYELDKLPESIYLNIKAIDVAKAIDYAVSDMKREGASGEMLAKFNEDIIQQAVDMLRERGIEATKIHRMPKGRVVKGYIEDPGQVFVRYAAGVAGGIAKGEASRQATEILTQIDPAKESRVYNTARNYIMENLRNVDASDRIIGVAKSLATFKFLGFNPRSPLVNMTAMITTAPAAIQQYAGGGKVGLTTVANEIKKAGRDYAAHMMGKTLTDPDDQAAVEDITKKGYDNPQLTRDAMGAMQGGIGRFWTNVMSKAMWMFGTSEQWNRGTTMLAGYRVAKAQLAKQGLAGDDLHKAAMDMAFEATEKAHAAYGRSNLPEWATGTNVSAKIGQTMYLYGNFGHNYVQLLYDLGLKQRNIKAFTWALATPLILAGGAVLPFKEELIAMLNAILKALGYEMGVDKLAWDGVRKHMGKTAETFGRRGLTGLAGVDISGSLGVSIAMPSTMWDLTGAAGGVWDDATKAWHFLGTGQPLRAAEKALPTAAANVIRGYRESGTGVTTERGRMVFDEYGKPLRPSNVEWALKTFGFKGSRQAVLQERQQEQREIEKRFQDKRDHIYELARVYYASPNRTGKQLTEILKRQAEFNRDVRDNNMLGIVPLIKAASLKRQAKAMAAPTKKARIALFRQNSP